MTCCNDKLLSILIFALGVFFSNAAQAQSPPCKQTLFLFRHAEDWSSGGGINRRRERRHATRYPAMITELQKDLETTGAPCDVQSGIRHVGSGHRGWEPTRGAHQSTHFIPRSH